MAGTALIPEGKAVRTARNKFLYVNNRLEGNALEKIDAILDGQEGKKVIHGWLRCQVRQHVNPFCFSRAINNNKCRSSIVLLLAHQQRDPHMSDLQIAKCHTKTSVTKSPQAV